MKAQFKCLKCNYCYEDIPTQCPKCYHLYVKWVNYEEMKTKLGWSKKFLMLAEEASRKRDKELVL